MDIKTFRKYKKNILNLYNILIVGDEVDNAEEKLNKFFSLEEQLFQCDLSSIPFKEWEGMVIISRDNGIMDFSRTHANLDFSLFKEFHYNALNLKGCNVKGIEFLPDYREDYFDSSYVESHPEYFPSKDLPVEIRDKYFAKRIEFEDLIEYPELVRCVNFSIFNSYSNSSRLVEVLGLSHALYLLEKEPQFISLITKNNGSWLSNIEKIEKQTYDEALERLCTEVIEALKKGLFSIDSIEILPISFREKHSEYYFSEKEKQNYLDIVFSLAEQEYINSLSLEAQERHLNYRKQQVLNMIDSYDKGTLTPRKIRIFQDQLNNKDIDIGIRNSKITRQIINIFGSFDNYLDKVPVELDFCLEGYIKKSYDYDMDLSSCTVDAILTEAVRLEIYNRNSFPSFSDAAVYKKYVSLGEIYGKYPMVSKFIQTCGFDILYDYNNENDYVLESVSLDVILISLAKGAIDIPKPNITNTQELEEYLKNIIFNIRNTKSVYLLSDTKEILSKISPENFITKEDKDYVKTIVGEDYSQNIEYLVDSAFNGDLNDLMYLLHKYKELLPLFESKKTLIDWNSNWLIETLLKTFWDNRGNNALLEMFTKYGESLKFLTLSVKDYELVDFSETLANSDNYEDILNEYIYDRCINKRYFDIRILPDSFKEKYKELFLPKDAPKDLCDTFYGKNGNYMRLSAKDIAKNPKWYKYLIGIDLSKTLKNKLFIMRDGYSDVESYDFYGMLRSHMSFEEVNEFVIKYGAYIDDCDFRIRKVYSAEKLKEMLYYNIYVHIVNGKISNYEEIPKEFRDRYPNIFLEEPQNVDDDFSKIKDDFYNRRINGDYIRSNPNCIKFLKNVDIEMIFPYMPFSKDDFDIRSNAVLLLREKLGYERTFKILVSYDKYLKKAIGEGYVNSDIFLTSEGVSINKIINEIEQGTYFSILKSGVEYYENMPLAFRERYPELFLPNDTPDDIKEKFYNRELTLNDVKNIDEFMQYFKNTNVALGFGKDVCWVCELYLDTDEPFELANYKRIKIVTEFKKIKDSSLKEMFKKFIEEEKENLDVKKIEVVAQMLQRLSNSNSLEMYSFKQVLAAQLIRLDDPVGGLDKVEAVFIKNNLPVVGKAYSVFKILHPSFSGFDFSDSSKISPILKKSSPRKREIITFSDLVRASFGSNNRSVKKYIETLEKGNALYEIVKERPNDYDKLTTKEKELFINFSNNLITLYNNTYKGKIGNCVEFSLNPIERVSQLKKILSPDGDIDYNLPDRAVSMFCHFAGFDTISQVKKYMESKIVQTEKTNILASKTSMILKKGDFIKGIGDIKYLSQILQNGSVAREYLGGNSADSDRTPLDTDVSVVMSDSGTVLENMKTTGAYNYGPIWFVLKNNERFTTTRTSEETLDTSSDISKIEAFYTGAIGEGHYGIRTGFASSEINYIVMENYDPRVGLEIAMNGFYIPVANTQGEIVFSYEEYDQLRTKMDGLKYYGVNSYNISENLVTEEVKQIVTKIKESQDETAYKREVINKHILRALDTASQVLGKELTLKTKFDGDLSEGVVELIDTGSTGRGTNKPGDGDFDFMMKLDREILKDPEILDKFRTILLESFGIPQDQIENYGKITDHGDFRLKGVHLDDVIVDIDISFSNKTDAIQYSTDESLMDRLSTIKEQYSNQYEYVIANILLAKQVLKDAGVYKPARGENPQGGLGGVGIENWILQNGGSFEDAAKGFLKEAEGKTFKEFVKSYKIWDFGENHMAARYSSAYPHDNFVSNNMNEDGYEKMKQTLSSHFNKQHKQQIITPNNEKVISKKM